MLGYWAYYYEMRICMHKNVLTELWTIRDFIRYLTTEFKRAGLYYSHGTTNAWDEAVALIFYALYLDHELYPQVIDAKLSQEEKCRINALAEERIIHRKPLPYLTHEAYFAGLKFYVDERVLIPRSPLAEVIENQFLPWIKDPNKVHHIMDLCCGSACIAIACAQFFPDAEIDAVDISDDALGVAEININKYEVNDRVRLIQSDLFSNIPQQAYDVIIANPPYVDAQDIKNLPNEFLHEPTLALSGGPDGLQYVRDILRNAAQYLNKQGILIVEVGNSAEALLEYFPQVPFTWLEFTKGEAEVFLLTKEQLTQCQVIASANYLV